MSLTLIQCIFKQANSRTIGDPCYHRGIRAHEFALIIRVDLAEVSVSEIRGAGGRERYTNENTHWYQRTPTRTGLWVPPALAEAYLRLCRRLHAVRRPAIWSGPASGRSTSRRRGPGKGGAAAQVYARLRGEADGTGQRHRWLTRAENGTTGHGCARCRTGGTRARSMRSGPSGTSATLRNTNPILENQISSSCRSSSTSVELQNWLFQIPIIF